MLWVLKYGSSLFVRVEMCVGLSMDACKSSAKNCGRSQLRARRSSSFRAQSHTKT